MAAQEYRRVLNQPGGGILLAQEQDRLFAEAVRRLLLKAVAMIEDRYGLTPISQGRREERAPKMLR